MEEPCLETNQGCAHKLLPMLYLLWQLRSAEIETRNVGRNYAVKAGESCLRDHVRWSHCMLLSWGSWNPVFIFYFDVYLSVHPLLIYSMWMIRQKKMLNICEVLGFSEGSNTGNPSFRLLYRVRVVCSVQVLLLSTKHQSCLTVV